MTEWAAEGRGWCKGKHCKVSLGQHSQMVCFVIDYSALKVSKADVILVMVTLIAIVVG